MGDEKLLEEFLRRLGKIRIRREEAAELSCDFQMPEVFISVFLLQLVISYSSNMWRMAQCKSTLWGFFFKPSMKTFKASLASEESVLINL